MALDGYDKLFVGKWTYVRDENVLAYMEATEASEEEKKLFPAMKPEVEFKRDGESIVIISKPFPGQDIHFDTKTKLEEPYEFSFGDMKNKCVFHWKNGGLMQDVVQSDGRPSFTVAFQIVNGELVETQTCKGVASKRFYKRA